MARPRSLKRMILDLIDEAHGLAGPVAEDLAITPHRLGRLTATPGIATPQERRAIQLQHADVMADSADVDHEKETPCTQTPTTESSPPTTSDPSPETTSIEPSDQATS